MRDPAVVGLSIKLKKLVPLTQERSHCIKNWFRLVLESGFLNEGSRCIEHSVDQTTDFFHFHREDVELLMEIHHAQFPKLTNVPTKHFGGFEPLKSMSYKYYRPISQCKNWHIMEKSQTFNHCYSENG